jgi:tetratricopeptide (TPR) repeat protein
MKLVSTLALAAAFVAGGVAAAPAAAQEKEKKDSASRVGKKGKEATAVPGQRKYTFSKEATKPIQDLNAAVTAKNHAEFAQRLAAAEAVAKSPDEKYVVAKLRLQHAFDIKDTAAQAAAMESVIASGAASAEEVALMTKNLGILASNSGNWASADAAFTRLIAGDPNNLELVVSLARFKLEQKKDAEALDLLQRAITLAKTQGKTVDEAWYRKALEIAHNRGNKPLALQLARDVMAAYPTAVNFRNALIVYQASANLDAEADLDLLRLMRAAGLLTGPGSYLALATQLNQSGLVGEAKSVLDEGRRLGVLKGAAGGQLMSTIEARIGEDRGSLPAVDAKSRAAANGTLAMRTANAYLGYGDYAKAADLYRVALQKGGVDSNLINTRLGIALALAGQKAEAQAALKAVTGARSELAQLWLAWLAQRT